MLRLKSRFCFLTIMTVNEESCGTAGRREKGCLVFFPERVAGSSDACTGRLTSTVLKSIALPLSLFYHGLI